jgi:hypothetical protein
MEIGKMGEGVPSPFLLEIILLPFLSLVTNLNNAVEIQCATSSQGLKVLCIVLVKYMIWLGHWLKKE